MSKTRPSSVSHGVILHALVINNNNYFIIPRRVHFNEFCRFVFLCMVYNTNANGHNSIVLILNVCVDICDNIKFTVGARKEGENTETLIIHIIILIIIAIIKTKMESQRFSKVAYLIFWIFLRSINIYVFPPTLYFIFVLFLWFSFIILTL